MSALEGDMLVWVLELILILRDKWLRVKDEGENRSYQNEPHDDVRISFLTCIIIEAIAIDYQRDCAPCCHHCRSLNVAQTLKAALDAEKEGATIVNRCGLPVDEYMR